MENQTNYQIDIVQITQQAENAYNGVKILFILDGEIFIDSDTEQFHLVKGDIFIINQHEKHRIYAKQENITLILCLNAYYFAHYYPKFFQYRFVYSDKSKEKGRENVFTFFQNKLAELGLVNLESYGNDSYSENLMMIERNILQIMLLLTRFFKQQKDKQYFTLTNEADERIQRIILYIEQHYTEKFTLKDIAEREFVSVSYLSRYFKKKTSLSFSYYVQRVRLKNSLAQLIDSNQKIDEIAWQNGFADVKQFRTLFKEVYEVTPTTYRKVHQQKMNVQLNKPIDFDWTKKELPITKITAALMAFNEKKAQIDLWQDATYEELLIEDIGKREPISASHNILKVGRISELLKASVQQRIIETLKTIPFECIAVTDLLSEDILLPDVVSDEQVSTYLRYSNLDIVLRFLQQQNLRLLIRIVPNEIEDIDNYMKKLHDFLLHVRFNFGTAFLEQWQIVYNLGEVTEESYLFFKNQYLTLRKVLQKLSGQINTGVYVNVQTVNQADSFVTTPLYKWLFEQKQQIDFYTCTIEPNTDLDTSLRQKKYVQVHQQIVEQLKSFQSTLKKAGLNKTTYLIYWNTLTGNTRLTNGVFFRGALILKAAVALNRLTSGISFWLSSDIFEKSDQVFQKIDGLELYNYEKIKRPVFYAMALKERIKGQLIASGDQFFLTEIEDGYQFLLMNDNYLNPALSVEELLVAKQRKEYFLHFLNLKPGFYQLKKITFDYQNGAVYEKMSSLSNVSGYDQELIDYINHITRPKMEVKDVHISADWSFYTYLDINGIQLFELKKIK